MRLVPFDRKCWNAKALSTHSVQILKIKIKQLQHNKFYSNSNLNVENSTSERCVHSKVNKYSSYYVAENFGIVTLEVKLKLTAVLNLTTKLIYSHFSRIIYIIFSFFGASSTVSNFIYLNINANLNFLSNWTLKKKISRKVLLQSSSSYLWLNVVFEFDGFHYIHIQYLFRHSLRIYCIKSQPIRNFTSKSHLKKFTSIAM